MRPLVPLLALCALLFFCACQAGPGPSSALVVQPAVGAGARVFAGPEDGVGGAVQVNLGKYGLQTGKAAEPAPVAPAPAPRAPQGATCADGTCTPPQAPGPKPAAPVAPTFDVGDRS